VTTGLVEWGVTAAALTGQAENGDAYVVEPFADGILVAVVDGLGHGREAAAAARLAVATLRRYPFEPLPVLFSRCHESLRQTRGVVLSAASFHARERTMAWLGVGNVLTLLQLGTLPADLTRRNMELFAAEVMPHLRRELDRPGAAAAAASVA